MNKRQMLFSLAAIRRSQEFEGFLEMIEQERNSLRERLEDCDSDRVAAVIQGELRAMSRILSIMDEAELAYATSKGL